VSWSSRQKDRQEAKAREVSEPQAEAEGAPAQSPAFEVRVDDDDDQAKSIASVEQLVAQGESEADSSSLDIDSGVVEKIVAITCRSVDGILQMKGNFISSLQEGFGGTDITKGVQVEMVGDDACVVSVSIIMEYGKSAKKIFNELHDRISEKVSDMTGLRVVGVKVRIVDVMTREDVEGRPRSGKSRSREATKQADEDAPVDACEQGAQGSVEEGATEAAEHAAPTGPDHARGGDGD
jgi:uncharacterized alkaline shock family protein YloU